MFKKIKKTEIFQGSLRKKKYFEGWYYKFVSKDLRYTLALIPGISLNNIDSHSFIQAFVSSTENQKNRLKTKYIRFELSEFKTTDNPFSLSIGSNGFSLDKISFNFKQNDFSLDGDLNISNLIPINTSFLNPSIMGFFDYFAFLECYHGVVSMSHQISGKVNYNNEIIDFTGGKGYIEKDWGKSFPKEYVWMQSNNFKDPNTSLMFSHAVIPFLGMRFKGLIANLTYDGCEYRFATYNFSKVLRKEISEKRVFYRLKHKKYILEIEALSKETKSLASPVNGVMNNTIKEGLSGEIKIKLFSSNNLIYEDFGTNAGLEIMMKDGKK